MERLVLLLLPWLLLLLLLVASHGKCVMAFRLGKKGLSDLTFLSYVLGQYEGAVAEDGKSPSIWNTYAHSGTRNPNERSGDISADGYHKYKEDVKLIKDIGLQVYRFSISWSRLIPNGRGALNPKGLQFYNDMINELVKEGIQIQAVIYHLDLPQILEDEYGGWLSPRIVDDFTAYADVCFREFGDRIAHWTTILEPNILAQGCYDIGICAPGHCSYPFGHDCTAVQKGVVGINLYSLCIYSLSDSTKDIQATERANDFLFGSILHPLLLGDYPESMKKAAGTRLPSFSSYESKLVSGAFDFIGLNHYSSIYASNNPNASKMTTRDQAADIGALFRESRDGQTATQALHDSGRGQTEDDLMDVERIDFLKKYIAATLKAIR
nr:unnamed protein product [Digitaria exilis]